MTRAGKFPEGKMDLLMKPTEPDLAPGDIKQYVVVRDVTPPTATAR
jgi:hypothetical protein